MFDRQQSIRQAAIALFGSDISFGLKEELSSGVVAIVRFLLDDRAG
jgi:hypothetical protein